MKAYLFVFLLLIKAQSIEVEKPNDFDCSGIIQINIYIPIY